MCIFEGQRHRRVRQRRSCGFGHPSIGRVFGKCCSDHQVPKTTWSIPACFRRFRRMRLHLCYRWKGVLESRDGSGSHPHPASPKTCTDPLLPTRYRTVQCQNSVCASARAIRPRSLEFLSIPHHEKQSTLISLELRREIECLAAFLPCMPYFSKLNTS